MEYGKQLIFSMILNDNIDYSEHNFYIAILEHSLEVHEQNEEYEQCSILLDYINYYKNELEKKY